MTREQERADLDPLAKQRQALEKKANGGDVTAIRELRENHECSGYGFSHAPGLG